MSISPIIASLDRLLQLHQSLVQLSHTKTELLKKGDATELQQLIKKEQKHIQAITKVEKQRVKETAQWAIAHQFDPETTTVTFILDQLTDQTAHQQLEETTKALTETLVELKQQESLNQQLAAQSLQFVQMNIEMIAPTLNNVNYGNQKNQSKDQGHSRSVFDSKA